MDLLPPLKPTFLTENDIRRFEEQFLPQRKVLVDLDINS